MKPRVVACANGWNEAKNLPRSLPSTNNQEGINLTAKVYVDDGSQDGSPDIAEDLGWEVVRLTWIHGDLSPTSWISKIFNKALKRLYELTTDFDYLLIAPCDFILPSTYVINLIEKMRRDQYVGVASGTEPGLYTSPEAPRGAGRLYDGSLWLNYIQYFPETNIWETWALLKARSLGYKTKTYYDEDLFMTCLRPTKIFKTLQGVAMRQLGYFPPYAFTRMMMIFRKHPKLAIQTMSNYLMSERDSTIVDDQMKRHLHYAQCKRFFTWTHYLGKLRKRYL